MWFLTPCLSCFLFLICSLILSQFWGTRFKGVVCSQNPCVFLSSVYVVLNVVYLRGFCSCIKHKHQWHVNHVAYRAECIPFLCPDRPHPHYCLQDIKRDFRFMSHLFWRFKPCLWFYFCNQSFIWITKAWNGDDWHNWQKIPPPVCGTPLHRAID